MGSLLRDVRYGIWILIKNRGFTMVALVALALGIGANTAIFSFADLLLRRPVALPQLDRLISIFEQVASTGDEGTSAANYRDLLENSRSFQDLAAYQFWSTAITGKGEPEEVAGVRVTSNFFSAIGVKPILGRAFLPDEEDLGKNRVVVLSDGFWRRRYGSDPAVLSKSIELDGQSYSVVGVMPRNSTFPLGAPVLWTPLAMTPAAQAERGELALTTVGRLRPGVTIEAATSEIESLWKNLQQQYPGTNSERTLRLLGLRERLVVDYNRQFMFLLLGVVGFVLLIACANVANLQLARATTRQREIALRSALGASRWRLVRQLLTESIVLALAGGVLGTLVALWGVRILRVTMPIEVQWFCDLSNLRLDFSALLFTLMTAVLAGVLSGLAPAWQQSRVDSTTALKEGSGRVSGGRTHRVRNLFVISEIGLALVLLIGTALMVKGFMLLVTRHPGLEPDSLLTLHVDLPQSRYAEIHDVRSFVDQAVERVQSVPGVRSAAVVSGVPFSFYEDNATMTVEGRIAVRPDELPVAMLESVSSDYFRTLNIPLREGREFNITDGPNAAGVAVVGQSLAKRFWPGESAIGKHLKPSTDPAAPWFTVVGVVGDIQHEIYDRTFRSVLYRPFAQAPPRSVDFVIRTSGNPTQLLVPIRFAIHDIQKDQIVEHEETMTQKINGQASGLRFVAMLMAAFAGIALLLSAVGVAGVMAYSVTERWHEIGIRMALGAQAGNVIQSVMRGGVFLTAIGLAGGAATAFALTRLLANLIYGVSAWDATVFAGIPVLLGVIALAACYIPARRATTVNPIVALRHE